MDEMNITGLIELQDRLTKRLLGLSIEKEERKQIIHELEVVSKLIDSYMRTATEEERVSVEREKSEIEADTKIQEAKLGLLGNVVRGACQFGTALIGGFATIFTVVKIVGAEENDRLVNSKALGFIPKFKL